MPPRDELVIPPLVLIGPVAAGKSTVDVVLLLPSPDPEESVRAQTRRRPPPEDFDWHRHFVTHRSNRLLAKLVVYTAGQTAEQTCEVVHRRLVRSTS